MKVSVSDGRAFKLQFVHSSHEFTSVKPVTPGGLRQFVDNLALSLRRRVSFADISLVEPDGVVDGKPTFKYTSIGQGFALCYYKDQFEKKTGRCYALDRALLVSGLDDQTQTELWEAVWGDYPPARPSVYGF